MADIGAATVPYSPVCAVCGSPLSTSKKYQIHKKDPSDQHSWTIGGQPYVGGPLADENAEHGCHKCYQANLKARKRQLAAESPFEGQAVGPKTKKAKSSDKIPVPTKHLHTLAGLVITSCEVCHSQWVFQQVQMEPTLTYIFQCANSHTTQWNLLTGSAPLPPPSIDGIKPDIE